MGLTTGSWEAQARNAEAMLTPSLSREQHLSVPCTVVVAGVEKAIVQSAEAGLPKLDSLWADDVPAPVWRSGNGAAKALGFFLQVATD